jgi:RNA polymerase sigma-70 factor (ECF subfamily)
LTAKAEKAAAERGDAEARLRQLMIGGLNGDSGAYRRLLSELSRRLRAYFARRLGPHAADLEDLVQETLLAVHLKRGTYDRSLPFTPWAYAVARYKLLDHFRRTSRRVHVPIEDAETLLAEETAEEGVVRADVRRLLDRLPERQRTLVEEVRIVGFTVEEAARRRGVTAVSARVMLHRSLKFLNQSVRDEDR